MELPAESLKCVRPTIEKILSISGTVGLSYGVLHSGKLIHSDNFGFRDHAQRPAVNEETIFLLCSFTKDIVASGLGILVDEGKLRWEAKMKDVVPGFRTLSEELHHSASLLDFLSMRTGMQHYTTCFKQVHPLRKGFKYDNWAYELAGLVFPTCGNSDWGQYLTKNIFQPLRLYRTTTGADELQVQNISRAYTVLDNANPVLVRNVQLSSRTLMGSAGGVRSCVSDLLKYYAAFLDAYEDQAASGNTSSFGSPFRQVVPITAPYSSLSSLGVDNQAYCMGWVRGRLPGPLGLTSNNFGNLGPHVPDIGEGAPPITTLNHAGSMVGATTRVILFPESKSAVIVFSNTLGLTDSSDTVSQLLTESLFDLPNKHDFVDITLKIADTELESMSRIAEKLDQNRTLNTQPGELQEYTGCYWNGTRTMKIDIFLNRNRLAMRFQDLEEETYALEHYEYDSFTWWMSRNDCVRRGRFTNNGQEYFKINFLGESGSIYGLAWKHDSQLSDPEMFTRT